jgi:antitoxin component of RelBE/YafQ-DinJ toxin-antitoxin module
MTKTITCVHARIDEKTKIRATAALKTTAEHALAFTYWDK